MLEPTPLKLDVIKTVKRLAGQPSKNDVLKGKLRGWLRNNEISIDDLVYHTKEGTIPVPAVTLNKLGLLYGLGKEGMQEDFRAAFTLFYAAAELGNPLAYGNCAQYYFDGRAPVGKKIDLAYYFCQRALDLGCDKSMLMSEILHEKHAYPESVKYLRRIIDNKQPTDRRKRLDARLLEKTCLVKELEHVFTVLYRTNHHHHHHNHHHTHHQNQNRSTGGNMVRWHEESNYHNPADERKTGGGGGIMLPTTGGSGGFSSSALSPWTLAGSPGKTVLSGVIRAPRGGIVASSSSGQYGSPEKQKASTGNLDDFFGGFSVPNKSKTAKRPKNPISTDSIDSASISTDGDDEDQNLLPGWFSITADIQGFDINACAQLTAKAEVLELEAEAVRAAFETAETHIAAARRNNYSEDIIKVLVSAKSSEFEEVYHNLLANKEVLLSAWNSYIDTEEHTIRRQVMSEQQFFDPHNCLSPITVELSRQLLQRRLLDEATKSDDGFFVADPTSLRSEPLNLSNFVDFLEEGGEVIYALNFFVI